MSDSFNIEVDGDELINLSKKPVFDYKLNLEDPDSDLELPTYFHEAQDFIRQKNDHLNWNTRDIQKIQEMQSYESVVAAVQFSPEQQEQDPENIRQSSVSYQRAKTHKMEISKPPKNYGLPQPSRTPKATSKNFGFSSNKKIPKLDLAIISEPPKMEKFNLSSDSDEDKGIEQKVMNLGSKIFNLFSGEIKSVTPRAGSSKFSFFDSSGKKPKAEEFNTDRTHFEMQSLQFSENEMEIEIESLEFHWDQLKTQISQYQNELSYANVFVKPHLDRIKFILLEEDRQILLDPQDCQIGECIEYASRKNYFLHLVILAEKDEPRGMFVIVLKFLTDLCQKIKSFQIMHSHKMHKQLSQIMRYVGDNIKNGGIQVNEKTQYSKAILDFVEMVCLTALDNDPQISNFFIQDDSTFLPFYVLLEFLKKEKVSQSFMIRKQLYKVILLSLKLKPESVQKYILNSSNFSQYLIGKLSFYIQLLPQVLEFGGNFQNLQTKLKNYSNEIFKSFRVFKFFVKFLDQICDISSQKLQKQICSLFFNEILVEKLKFLSEDINNKKTSYLIFLEILAKIQNQNLILTLFRFIFGKQLKNANNSPIKPQEISNLQKIDFKAKNMASSLRIFQPFGNIDEQKMQLNFEIAQMIENEEIQNTSQISEFQEQEPDFSNEIIFQNFMQSLGIQNFDTELKLISLLIIEKFLSKNIQEINNKLVYSPYSDSQKKSQNLDFNFPCMNYYSYGAFSADFMEINLKNNVKIKSKDISKYENQILKDTDQLQTQIRDLKYTTDKRNSIRSLNSIENWDKFQSYDSNISIKVKIQQKTYKFESLILDESLGEISESDECDISNESCQSRKETHESVKSKENRSGLAVRQGATGGTETARGDQMQTESDLAGEPGETADLLSDHEEENIRPSILQESRNIKTAIPIVKRSKELKCQPMMLQIINDYFISNFFDNPIEINILVLAILEHIYKQNWKNDKVLKIYRSKIFAKAEYILENRVKVNKNIEQAQIWRYCVQASMDQMKDVIPSFDRLSNKHLLSQMPDLDPKFKTLTDHEEILEKCHMTFRGSKEEIQGVAIACLMLNQVKSQQVYHNLVLAMDAGYGEAYEQDQIFEAAMLQGQIN